MQVLINILVAVSSHKYVLPDVFTYWGRGELGAGELNARD